MRKQINSGGDGKKRDGRVSDVHREWLSEKDLETLTGMSRKTFQKYRLFGKGPAFRRLNGKTVRYHKSDVEAWLDSCPRGGGAMEGREAC